MEKRQIKYDYLRAIAVMAIVTVHAIPAESANQNQWLFAAAVTPVLLAFVGIYFMLSGLFLLNSGTEDIKGFYWKRLKEIGIPFFFCSPCYYAYYVYLSRESLDLTWLEHVKAFVHGLLEGTIPQTSHLWFMYVIMALYLCAPFLARMLQAMTDRELKIFLILMVAVQGLCTYMNLFQINVEGSLEYMIFKGWVIYFILGYGLKRLCTRKQTGLFVFLGIGGYGITMFQKIFTPDNLPGIHDLAPTMTAMAACIFILFEFYGDRGPAFLKKAAFFISRHSYTLYLIHYFILHYFVRAAVETSGARHYYLARIGWSAGLTFAVSLAAAWLMDETVFRFLKGRWRHRKREVKG